MWRTLLIQSMEDTAWGRKELWLEVDTMPPWITHSALLAGGRTLETMSVAGGGYSHFHRVFPEGYQSGEQDLLL